jgi:hypothetical protein
MVVADAPGAVLLTLLMPLVLAVGFRRTTPPLRPDPVLP